jgi:hypothetical protein
MARAKKKTEEAAAAAHGHLVEIVSPDDRSQQLAAGNKGMDADFSAASSRIKLSNATCSNLCFLRHAEMLLGNLLSLPTSSDLSERSERMNERAKRANVE